MAGSIIKTIGYPLSTANIVGRTDGAGPAAGAIGELNQGTLASGTGGHTYIASSTTAPGTSWTPVVSDTFSKGVYWVSFSSSVTNPTSVRPWYKRVTIGGSQVTSNSLGIQNINDMGWATWSISIPIVITADNTVIQCDQYTTSTACNGGYHAMFAVRIA